MAQHNRRSGAMDESTASVGWSVDSWEDATDSYGVRVYGTTEPRAGRHDARRDVMRDVMRDAEEYHPWREADAYAARAPSVSRDRAATVARPLGHDGHDDGHALVERRGAGQVMSDARDTLIIMPSMRPQAISPLAPPRSRASVPVTVVRTLLVSLVLYYVLSSSLQIAGRSGLPLAPFPWAAANGSASALAVQASPLMDGKVASRVRPMTQMRRVDLYDSRAQFNLWGGADCSAASLAEVLTAYGLPHMTIGRVIREMGADISPNWGLLTYNAFNKVVAKYGLRADVYLSNNPLNYKQMLYLTNTLGVPVLVNMRATTGYYHFLSGGHILVMTGGDSKTIRLTDSSLYYIKSLPLSTYNWMARPRNVVIVPKDFHYTLPH